MSKIHDTPIIPFVTVVKQKTFSELTSLDRPEGIVIVGCEKSTSEHLDKRLSGLVSKFFSYEYLLKMPIKLGAFEQPFYLQRTDGTIDLVFKLESIQNMTSELVAWKIKYGDWAYWISDYIKINKQY